MRAGSPSTGRESMGVSGLEFNMVSAGANKVDSSSNNRG